MEQLAAVDFGTPAGVAGPMTRDMRRQQCVEVQPAVQGWIHDFEPGMHQQHRPVRICKDVLDQLVAPVGLRVGEAVENTIAFRVFDPVAQVALFLVAKRFPVGDQELKIARVRRVNRGVVNLVDDAMAEREPEPAARMISGAQAFLRAGSPAGFDAGRTECHRVFRRVHAGIRCGIAAGRRDNRRNRVRLATARRGSNNSATLRCRPPSPDDAGGPP